MRKKTISHLLDSVMWYLIYILPLIAFGILLVNNSAVTLSSAMTSVGLGILTDNVVFTALSGIFGAGGVLPLFASADILLYFSYFVCVWICHLAVDVLLFLVRYAHKLMSSFGGDN